MEQAIPVLFLVVAFFSYGMAETVALRVVHDTQGRLPEGRRMVLFWLMCAIISGLVGVFLLLPTLLSLYF